MILGTAPYLSPEQARGRDADRRSDIWAFGAVLFEMLSGERAFKGGETVDILSAVIRDDIDWTALPASTPGYLRRLMAIEPNFTVERFIATSPLERESDRDLFAEGLRLAGVPETGADASEQLQDQVAH